MRLPRVRFTTRRIMIAVAILALVSLWGRDYLARRLRRAYRNPVHTSQLGAGLTWNGAPRVLAPGSTVPVSITYDFRFADPKPKPGTSCLLLATVWFEDQKTGRSVDSYSFDATLTVGGREATSGTITWDAQIPHPGRYMLRRHLYHEGPDGEMRGGTGGGSSCVFLAAPVSPPISFVPGGNP